MESRLLIVESPEGVCMFDMDRQAVFSQGDSRQTAFRRLEECARSLHDSYAADGLNWLDHMEKVTGFLEGIYASATERDFKDLIAEEIVGRDPISVVETRLKQKTGGGQLVGCR